MVAATVGLGVPLGCPYDRDVEPDGRIEQTLYRAGFRRVAGVDETGRGALAGPLVTCAVILPDDVEIPGLRDSKLLTPAARERLASEILRHALAVSVVKVRAGSIDRRGLHRSNLRALRAAAVRLDPEPDYLLVDGYAVARAPFPALAIKAGDRVSKTIAAASIVAKVTRDRIMRALGRRFPEYGFVENKGYGTAEHWDAIREFGPSPYHRLSFNGVGQMSLWGAEGA